MFWLVIVFGIYEKLNLDVLDGDGLDETQVALGCKFER
jgi:hypothetical protein